MNLIYVLLTLIGIGLLIYAIYWFVHFLMRNRSAKIMDQADLQGQLRTTQIIDVRESPEFDAKHILGARNIPMSQFKMRFQEIRKDKPVLLYDENLNAASRAANILRQNGYQQVYILKGGFTQWLGKVKSEL